MHNQEKPDPSPWELGAYYECTDKVRVRVAWGARISNCCAVPAGTVWLCNRGHYIAHDVVINSHRKNTGIFKKIDSPLKALALAEAGLAPIVDQ